jgi:hypothetical protein
MFMDPEEFALIANFIDQLDDPESFSGVSAIDGSHSTNEKSTVTNEAGNIKASQYTDAVDYGLNPDLVGLGEKACTGVVTAKEIGSIIADLGTDNHAQAELVESLFSKEIAQHVDGEVLNDASSVFAPDGGVDAVIRTADGDLTVQVKNLADPVGDATLAEYEGLVDYFASANDFKQGTDPTNYGMEGFSKDDWLWASKAELRTNQFFNGVQQIFIKIRDAIQSFAGQTKEILSKVAKHAASKATAAASWFFALSAGQQLGALAAVVAVAVAVYYVYKWYQNHDYDHSSTGGVSPI